VFGVDCLKGVRGVAGLAERPARQFDASQPGNGPSVALRIEQDIAHQDGGAVQLHVDPRIEYAKPDVVDPGFIDQVHEVVVLELAVVTDVQLSYHADPDVHMQAAAADAINRMDRCAREALDIRDADPYKLRGPALSSQRTAVEDLAACLVGEGVHDPSEDVGVVECPLRRFTKLTGAVTNELNCLQAIAREEDAVGVAAEIRGLFAQGWAKFAGTESAFVMRDQNHRVARGREVEIREPSIVSRRRDRRDRTVAGA
jgi:hypothetical protein